MNASWTSDPEPDVSERPSPSRYSAKVCAAVVRVAVCVKPMIKDPFGNTFCFNNSELFPQKPLPLCSLVMKWEGNSGQNRGTSAIPSHCGEAWGNRLKEWGPMGGWWREPCTKCGIAVLSRCRHPLCGSAPGLAGRRI